MAATPASEVGRHPRDRAPPGPLARSRLPESAPVLLPGRSGGDRDLAGGGPRRAPGVGAASSYGTSSDLESPSEREPRREPRSVPPGAQDGDRLGQDDRDGDADRVADGERGPSPAAAEVHERVPGGCPRDHDPGPAPRPPTERPRQAPTAATSSFPATCGRTWTKRSSSSRTTTPSSAASAGSSARAPRILVLNDEGHHCYREKPGRSKERKLESDEKAHAKKDAEAARCWISGLETVRRKIEVPAVFDLSATPFFLRGSGYAEGTLFPWTVSDFALMDAIECGIVKLPRVPVSDNVVSRDDMPRLRDLWKHIGKAMPRPRMRMATREKLLDPQRLPALLETASTSATGSPWRGISLLRAVASSSRSATRTCIESAR